MLSLPAPIHTAEETFAACISRVRNPALRARLEAAVPTITDASAAFHDAATRHAVHELVRNPIVAPDVTTQEMEDVYTLRMARMGRPGRRIYDAIFTSSPQGRCPLCMQRQVSTLDHHLPKAHYPALAVA